jgi:two-component system phosphate regulon sensor histidine kinase PhoR
MPRASFQTKLFLSAFSTAVIALAVAGVLVAWLMQRDTNARVEQTLRLEARLAAELLETSRSTPDLAASSTRAALDAVADRIGTLLTARVTLIAADGTVVGDSAEPADALASMENHGTRPEVNAARAGGMGMSRRSSATLGQEMLYAAVPARHPQVAFVRVALPLTSIREQLRAVLVITVAALGLALLGGAAVAAVLAGRIGQRVRAIAWIAERYREGDLTPPRLDYGDDELGVVARALDDSVHELGNRLADLDRDRGRMAAILAGMIEGVIAIDRSGRLQLVNAAAQEMLKIEEPPVGRSYVEMIREPAITDLVGAALGGGSPEPVEFAPPRDAGRTIIARAAPVTQGWPHGVVLVLHDVTELKRADAMRRDFVSNVSHELRTPLTAIRGYVEALADGDATRDESARFLEIITRHTLRMERMVQDLLKLARLDARQETLDLQTCDVGAVARAVASDLAGALDARDQQVDLRIDGAARQVRADPAKLQDILRNLVANASAYAPVRTTITLATRVVGDRVAIDVLDEGPGIPEADRLRVFERFYRVDRSRARDPGGTGLGLAIVRHLTELHGGRVSVSSAPGGGSWFTVELPRADSAAPPRP